MTLMHLGCSMARKPLSLIVIKDSFHQVTHLGMTHGHLRMARQAVIFEWQNR
jgi:hypothetical protein